MKLHKGDLVKVTAGKDKGKEGKILKVIPLDNKVLVEDVNQFKRHIKKNVQGQKSEIVTISKPLSVGSVVIICPKCKKQTRVGYSTIKGSKVRICRKCGKEI